MRVEEIRIRAIRGSSLSLASVGDVAWLCQGKGDLAPVCDHNFSLKLYDSYLDGRKPNQPLCPFCTPLPMFAEGESEEDESSSEEESESEVSDLQEESEPENQESSSANDRELYDFGRLRKKYEKFLPYQARKYILRANPPGEKTILDRMKEDFASFGLLLKRAEFVFARSSHVLCVTRVTLEEVGLKDKIAIVDELYRLAGKDDAVFSLIGHPLQKAEEQDVYLNPDRHALDYSDAFHSCDFLFAWSIERATRKISLAGIASYRDNLHRGDLKDWIETRLNYFNVFTKRSGDGKALAEFISDAVMERRRGRDLEGDPIGLTKYVKNSGIDFDRSRSDYSFHPLAELSFINPESTAASGPRRRPTRFEMTAYQNSKTAFGHESWKGTFHFDELMASDLPTAEPLEMGSGIRALRQFKKGEVITSVDPFQLESPEGLSGKQLAGFVNETSLIEDANCVLYPVRYPFYKPGRPDSPNETRLVLIATKEIDYGSELLIHRRDDPPPETLERAMEDYERDLKYPRLIAMEKFWELVRSYGTLSEEKIRDLNIRNLLRIYRHTKNLESPFQADLQRVRGTAGDALVNIDSLTRGVPAVQGLLHHFAAANYSVATYLLNCVETSLKASAWRARLLENELCQAYLFAFPRKHPDLGAWEDALDTLHKERDALRNQQDSVLLEFDEKIHKEKDSVERNSREKKRLEEENQTLLQTHLLLKEQLSSRQTQIDFDPSSRHDPVWYQGVIKEMFKILQDMQETYSKLKSGEVNVAILTEKIKQANEEINNLERSQQETSDKIRDKLKRVEEQIETRAREASNVPTEGGRVQTHLAKMRFTSNFAHLFDRRDNAYLKDALIKGPLL